MEIPERILSEIQELAPLLGDNDDWMVLKKLLLLQIPSDLRRLFSTRHPVTKKQSLNEFEKEIVREYYSLTGIHLTIKQ